MGNFFKKSFEGNNKWYTYLIVAILALIGGQFVGAIPLVIYTIIYDVDLTSNAPLTTMGFILMLLPFVTTFLFFYIGVVYIQKKKFLSVITGRNRLDFRRIAIGAGLWGAITIIIFLLELPFTDNLEFRFDASKFIPLFIASLILVPFQTTIEEIIVRGSWLQGIYILTKRKWLALLIPTLLFALAHSANPEIETYGFWTAMGMYLIISILLGLITVLDDGLELAIGVHFANNLIAFNFVSSEGGAIPTLGSIFVETTTTQITGIDFIIFIASCLLFFYIAKFIFKFKFSALKD